MPKLSLTLKDNKDRVITYTFNPNAEFVGKDDKTYRFISFRKDKIYKGKSQWQNLTIKPEHWEEFRLFLREVIEIGIDVEYGKDEPLPEQTKAEPEVPF